jgi:hypothetical protein
MKKTVTVIEQRPHYYRGQLLLEDDFLAEQNYHANARCRHNLNLHGWGVVGGLKVTRKTANSITINPGFALDESGREVFLDESLELDLAEFGPNETLEVSLKYEEAGDSNGGEAPQQKRRDVCALVAISRGAGDGMGVILATLQLDGQGRLGKNGIDYEKTRYVRILAPGSVKSSDLHDSLKTGWLRFPFRPVALVNKPEGEEEIPPAFRIGATEALSPRPKEGQPENGAAGSMAIPLPPGVTLVTRLRIAGARNEGRIKFMLLLGGWDPQQKKHDRKTLLDTEITTPGPFLEEFDIDDTLLNPEYQTMALWLRGTQRTAISLIAVEFTYY